MWPANDLNVLSDDHGVLYLWKTDLLRNYFMHFNQFLNPVFQGHSEASLS